MNGFRSNLQRFAEIREQVFQGVVRAGPARVLPPAGIILAGMFFRLYQLPGQILVDDEWHALHKMLFSDYKGIFTDLGVADHCIPLTLLYMFLLKNFWLSEILMRLPSIAAGFITLLLVPVSVTRIIGNRAAVISACLLSISPLHIFYSRLARPYALSMLLSFCAVMAFYFWWTGKGRAWMAAYLLSGVLSVWFLLPSLPFVAGPFLFALLHSAFRKNSAGGLNRLFLPGIIFSSGVLLLLLPPFLSSPGVIWGKAGRETVTWWTLKESWKLFAGTANLWLLLGLAALSITGMVMLVRKNRVFGFYALLLTGLQLLGFLVAAPLGSRMAILLNRYSIAVLPFLLIWIAIPLACRTGFKPLDAVNRYSFVLLALLLLLFGPFRDIYFYPNHFTNYGGFQMRYDLTAWLKKVSLPEVPEFYRELAGLKNGQVTLVEAPWHYNDNIFAYYQWLHRQNMLIGFVGDLNGTFRAGEVPARDPRFRLRNFVHVSDFNRIEKTGVDFVIFHKSLEEERKSDIPVCVADVSSWLELYQERYGSPAYEDRFLTVYRIP